MAQRPSKIQATPELSPQTIETLTQMEQVRQTAYKHMLTMSSQWTTLPAIDQEGALLLLTACTAVYRTYQDQLYPMPKASTPQQSWDRDAGCALIAAFNQKTDKQTDAQIILVAYSLLKPDSKASCTLHQWPFQLDQCIGRHRQEALRTIATQLTIQAQARKAKIDAELEAELANLTVAHQMHPRK